MAKKKAAKRKPQKKAKRKVAKKKAKRKAAKPKKRKSECPTCGHEIDHSEICSCEDDLDTAHSELEEIADALQDRAQEVKDVVNLIEEARGHDEHVEAMEEASTQLKILLGAEFPDEASVRSVLNDIEDWENTRNVM